RPAQGQRRQGRRRRRRRDGAVAGRGVLPVRPRHSRDRRALASRQRRCVVAARPDRGSPRGIADARGLQRPGLRFRRRALDDSRGDRRRRSRAGAVRVAVRAVQLARRGVVRRSAAVRDAEAVRRARGEDARRWLMRVAHDISVPIRPDMHVYDGNPGVSIESHSSIAGGAHANVSRLALGVHSGTHVDGPRHFIDGVAGPESLPRAAMVGPAVVADATDLRTDVDADALAGLDLPDGAKRVLLKTRNSELWNRPSFTRDFIRLTGSGARYLIDRGVRLIGIDYLSIGDEEAHRGLLANDIVALEGLDLREVDAGDYELVCLPIRLEGSDGAPARAVLFRV